MVGKADVADGAALLFRRDPLPDAQSLQLLPLGVVGHHVHQVVVDIVRAQALELLLEDPVRGRYALDHVLGQLGGHVDLLPDAVALQDLPQGGLAAGIDIGGVVVIDAAPVGGHQLPLGLVQVDAGPLPGKSHATVAQDGQFPSGSILSVLHRHSSLLVSPAAFLRRRAPGILCGDYSLSPLENLPSGCFFATLALQ